MRVQVIVELQRPPLGAFDDIAAAQSNYVRFRLSPEVVIALGARVKRPGEEMAGEAVELAARHARHRRLGVRASAGRCARGRRLAVRQRRRRGGGVAVVEPILGDAAPLADYEPGTWGPAAARTVVASEEGWQDPKREDSAPC